MVDSRRRRVGFGEGINDPGLAVPSVDIVRFLDMAEFANIADYRRSATLSLRSSRGWPSTEERFAKAEDNSGATPRASTLCDPSPGPYQVSPSVGIRVRRE